MRGLADSMEFVDHAQREIDSQEIPREVWCRRRRNVNNCNETTVTLTDLSGVFVSSASNIG